MESATLHLSQVLKSDILDRGGERLGRVRDLIVRLGEEGYPPLTGVRASVAGREVFIPIERVASIEAGRVALAGEKLSLRRFERRDEEILLAQDVLDRQLINVDGARLVRANDIGLARVDGRWRVVGVDVSLAGVWRRLLPRPIARRRSSERELLDWESVEPFVGHVPTLRLRIPHPRLARLHPAQIADLVEAASHDEGEEIIEAVGSDRELEADVFEELDDRHQVEFLRDRSDAEAARVLSRMAPDDAADLLFELDEDRRGALLELLPYVAQRKVRMLLGYDPATAGGLMSPDFLALRADATVGEAQDRVRHASCPDEALAEIFVVDEHRRPTGQIKLPALLRRPAETPVGEIAVEGPVTLATDAEFEEVARAMSDYNLVSAPVVDDEGELVGVVTVDDVLEVMLPSGWRRRFGLLGND